MDANSPASPTSGMTERQPCKRKRSSVHDNGIEDEENLYRKLSDLERLLQKTQEDLIQARSISSDLERQIDENERAQSQKFQEYERCETEMRAKIMETMNRFDVMTDLVSQMSKNEQELKMELRHRNEIHSKEINAIETKLINLETENIELKGKLNLDTLQISHNSRRLIEAGTQVDSFGIGETNELGNGNTNRINGTSFEELEDKIKELENRLEILSAAYEFETHHLQIVVDKLCGFNVTFIQMPTVQIHLLSIYSQSMDDTFIFQESPNGDVVLHESPVLDNFRDEIDRFLLREESIPAFLASVTSTFMQRRNVQNEEENIEQENDEIEEVVEEEELEQLDDDADGIIFVDLNGEADFSEDSGMIENDD